MVAISNLPIGQAIYSPIVTISSSAAVTSWDWTSAQNAIYTAVENTTLTPINMKPGMKASLYFYQSGTLARTMAYSAACQPSNNLPLMTSALNSVCYTEWSSPDGTSVVNDKFIQNAVI